MDNITRSLISQLLGHLDIPEGKGYHEDKFHWIIQRNNLDLSNPRVSKETIGLLLEGEFEYAYIQVILNSVIPEGPASEFMEGAIKYRLDEDHYGHVSYDLGIVDKMTLLKKQDPLWVWRNHDALTEFMEDSWEPYLKVQQIIDNINSL
jgi:hypothetical protein